MLNLFRILHPLTKIKNKVYRLSPKLGHELETELFLLKDKKYYNSWKNYTRKSLWHWITEKLTRFLKYFQKNI
jgi:hypothetical protein